jgi:hypothetical protein
MTESTDPHEPTAGPPDADMVERLRWSDRPMSADRVVRPLRSIETAHLWAIAGYLRWHADWLASNDPQHLPDEALADYVRMLPIWIAIECELVRRGQLVVALYDTLREQGGLVPWETMTDEDSPGRLARRSDDRP